MCRGVEEGVMPYLQAGVDGLSVQRGAAGQSGAARLTVERQKQEPSATSQSSVTWLIGANLSLSELAKGMAIA